MDEAIIKKIMPHSIDSEKAVIGSMIMEADAIVAASEVITGDDFYQRQFGILFEPMVELYNEGKPVAVLTLQGASDLLGEHDGILFLGAPLDGRFKDAPQVADGYLLLHQPLEDFRNTLRGQQAGGFADQIGGAFLHLVEQVLGFLHTEER